MVVVGGRKIGKLKEGVKSKLPIPHLLRKPRIPSSKYYKQLDNTFGRAFRAEEAYEEMHKPHFKRY